MDLDGMTVTLLMMSLRKCLLRDMTYKIMLNFLDG